MNWLSFFASLVNSLVWPAVAVVLLVFLRPYLGRLVELIKTVKYKGFEMGFGEATPAAARQLTDFWLPDGKTPNVENQEALKVWMRANGLSGVSITTLLNAAPLDAARRSAVQDLGLAQPMTGDADD